MDREKLYYVLYEQQKNLAEKKVYVPRELTPKVIQLLKLGQPIIITGVRRAGKSTLLTLIQQQLQLQKKEYLYIDFNDERLILFVPEDFQKIDDFMHENGYDERCYFFIDEIQEVKSWEKWVNRIKEKHPVIITGSNSKLLSKEISSVLTGRSINVHLHPFSFREILTYKNVDKQLALRDFEVRGAVRKELREYMDSGGVPKFILEKEKKILTELYENIVYRDIVKRFNPSLEKPIKEVSLFLLSNVSKELSYRSVSSLINVKNVSTVKSIVDTFEKSFLFYFVPKFDFSVRKQIQNVRKIYCVDNGFVTKVGFRFSEDQGRLLENMVFMELKGKENDIYYFSEKGECDFVIRTGTKITQAIQVCYNLNPENREREINGLKKAMERFNLDEGTIITYDDEKEIKLGKRKIKVTPVWKWML